MYVRKSGRAKDGVCVQADGAIQARVHSWDFVFHAESSVFSPLTLGSHRRLMGLRGDVYASCLGQHRALHALPWRT